MGVAELPAKKFNIYSGILKAYTSEDGKKRLKTVASSTIKDRAGDEMTPRAIERMAESARDNMTIFLNHKYLVPEDVFGSVEGVNIVGRGDAVDLEFDIRLNEANDRALKTYEAIAAGTKLGTSIGAQIPDGGATKSTNGHGWVFDDVELLEASIVGIPANPRSWVQYAVKSMTDLEPDEPDPDEPEPVPAETKAKVWVTQDGKGNTEIAVDTDVASEETKDAEVTQSVEDELLDPDTDWANLPEGDEAEAAELMSAYDAIEAAEKAANVEFTAKTIEDILLVKAPMSSETRNNLSDSQFACPAKRKYPINDKAHIRAALSRCADKSNDQCGCDKVKAAARRAGIGDSSKEVTPDLTKDETPSAQEVTQTEPEPAQEAPAEEITNEVIPLKAAEMDGLMDLLKTAMSELVESRKKIIDLSVEKSAAEKERDQLRTKFAEAEEIVERIASLPIGRRTGFAEGVSEFRAKFSDMYDDNFLALLERKSDGD